MKISLARKIKRIAIATLTCLMTLCVGLGVFATAHHGVAQAESAKDAYFLYRDDETKGSWYSGNTTTRENAGERVYGTSGYMIPYMECVPGLKNGLGQPATDVELINDFTEDSTVNCVEYPSWLDGIDSYIKSTRDTPHGYWMYETTAGRQPEEYILKAPDVERYKNELGRPVICWQGSNAEIEYTFHVNDDGWHRVAVYMQTLYSNYVENPFQSAALSISDLDGNVLEKVDVSGYDNGTWFVFAVKGSFTFRADRGSGATLLGVGGIFLDDAYEDESIGISNVGAMRQGVKTVHLGWQSASEDTVAMIYRRVKGEDSWGFLAIENGTSYVDNTTEPATTYQYMLVPAKKKQVSGMTLGAYDVFVPDEALSVEKETAPYDLTKIVFEKESYVVPYGEALEAKVTVYRQENGEYIPYPNVDVKFTLEGGMSQYFVGSTSHANMNLDLATVKTDENGEASFTYHQPYAGQYSIVANIEAIADPSNPEFGTAASSGSTVFTQLEKADEKTPMVWTISDAIKPGDTVTITGSNLVPNSDLRVAYAPSMNGNPSAFDENSEPYNCKYLTLENMIVIDSTYETGLSFIFPEKEIAGTYDVWVKTSYGWSNGITLNAARPLYMNQDGGYEGITVELVGRNFFVSDFGIGTRENAPSKIRVKLVRISDLYGNDDGIQETQILKVKTGVRTTAKNAVNGKDIEWTNPYKLSFDVPKVNNYGTYAVYVAADGVCYKGLQQPQTLTIYPKKAQAWDETVFGPIAENTHIGNDPLDLGFYWAQDLNYTNVATVTPNQAPGEELTDNAGVKATTNDITSKMSQLSRAGGGVLYFPEGNYYITNIMIPANVMLVGAGVDKTNLYCVTKTGNGIWLRSLSSNVGIARMNLELYEYSGANPDMILNIGENSSVGSYVDPKLSTVNKFITDCTMKFSTDAEMGKRALVSMGGKEYVLMQNVYYDGGNNPLYNSYSQAYSTLRNVVAENLGGPDPVAPSVQATYTFVENVYLDLDRSGHAYSIRNCGYIAHSYVQGAGAVNGGNDGEMIVFEPPGGYFSTGTILSATDRTFTTSIHSGSMIDENSYYKFNGFAIFISGGKGAGQLRYFEKTPLNEYGNEYALVAGEEAWDILPDSTSTFTIISPMEGATVYRFEGNNSKKGIFLYSIMFDSVVAECTLTDSEGIFVSATDINQTGRFCPNIGVRIENNVISGNSSMTGGGGILFRSERNSSLESWGVQMMNLSIRGNVVTDIGGEYTADQNPRASEAPDQRGIVIATGSTSSGQTAGDVRFITIEGNTVNGSEYGIYVENRTTGVVIRDNNISEIDVGEELVYFSPEQMYATAKHQLYVNGTLSNLSGEYVYGLNLPSLADTATDVFLGWSLTQEYDSDIGITTQALGANSTLYAVYGKQVVFKLNYQKNGADVGDFNIIKVPTGNTVETEMAIYGNPFRVGYRFGGWYTDEACTVEFDASTAIDENKTVYAKWISNSGEEPKDDAVNNEDKDNGSNVGVIIGISCGAVALVGAGAVGFIIWKKKKSK